MSQAFDHRCLYDRLAPFYAPAMCVLPVWRRYTEQVLPWLPLSGAILEIGPGPGVLLQRIAARHPLAFGCDLSRGMLHRAQRRLRRAGLVPRLVQGDAARLPFADGAFDAVVMTFAFSAIPDGVGAVSEMRRVLRDDGVLALVDAGEPGDGGLAGRWLARQWKRFGDYLRDEAELMRAAGFDVIERREFGAFDGIRLVVGRASRARAPAGSSRDHVRP